MAEGKLTSNFNDWTLNSYEVLPIKDELAAQKQPVKPLRTWTSASGNFKVKARLESVDGQELVLGKKDGSTIRVELSKLSTLDREWIKSQKEK